MSALLQERHAAVHPDPGPCPVIATERLTLLANRTRQASITTEIIEIVSGAAALDG